MRTPALYALLLFIAGILTGVYFDIHAFILYCTCAVALATTLILLAVGNTRLAQWTLSPAILIAGILLTQLQTGDFPSNHISNFTNLSHKLEICGVITSEPDIRPDKTYLTVAVDSIGRGDRHIPVSGQLRLRIAEATNRFNYHDRIEFESWLNRPNSARNPGAFDYQRYLEIREIHALAFAGSAAEITLVNSGASEPFIRTIVSPVRDYIGRVFDRDMRPHQAALLKGFLLGDVRFIPSDLYRRFKDTGTLHVLAASGANVGYVVGALLLFGRLLGIRRRSIYALAIVGVIVFSFLAFNQPSVVRAAVMAVIVLVGKLLRRDANWINTISLAGLIILAFRPLYLFDLGTQLSFAAAFSLILFLPAIEPLLPVARPGTNRFMRYFLLIFWSTLVAQVGVLPILLFHFQTVPLVSFLANLVVVPLVGLVATLGIVLIAFSGVPYLSSLLGHLCGAAIDLVLGSIDYFESLQIPPIEIGAPDLLVVLLYYLVIQLIYLIFTRSRLVGWVTLLVVLLINVALWKPVVAGNKSDGSVTVLDTWDTPTLVIASGSSETTLINGGGVYRSFDRGESVVLPYLRYRGISAIDRYLTTDCGPANQQSLKSVILGLQPPLTRRYEPDPNSTGGSIDTLSPFSFLHINQTEIALLLDPGSVHDLSNLVHEVALLVITHDYADEERLGRLVELFHPETVVISTYASRYRKRDQLDHLRSVFPDIAIYSVRDQGAITIQIQDKGYEVLEMSND